MSWINIRYVLEALSFISGPIMVIIAFKALDQIKMAKATLNIESRRSAAIIAAQQLEVFKDKIVVSMDALTKYKGENNFKLSKRELQEFTLEEVKESSEEVKKDFDKGMQFILHDNLTSQLVFLDPANALESFSVYFIKKIADEDIVFSSTHEILIDFVEKNYFFYCLLRKNGSSRYQNTLDLYRAWKQKSLKQKLILESKQIEKRLNEVKDTIIKPIGTEDV